ncbi:MAG: glycosyltransferase [Methylovulum sp.]|jgi:exo-beta-1,3-glucanase (GH17 family)/cellulose synthase/poly-beta-1,6-N-acetylglucosamine synthase-like glycosyltransferase|nr:glycosyltransferase [Methylovulum sp.]MCF7999149.1 glycosyltransferase [Methylovulum sp.]
MKKKIATLFAVALLVMINFSIWSYVNNPLQLQPWTKTTMGLTYDPTRKGDDPRENISVSEEDIDKDLALLENKVHAIRTYSMLRGQHKIPEIAAKHNLNVTLGAWIDNNLEKNRQELETLIDISHQNSPKIIRLMVGNEVMLRDDIPEDALIEYIREVKKRVGGKPVSTSETWAEWLKHPKLVEEVDFIAVHILPYWEGIAADDAVDYIFDRFHDVQKAYPNKPVIITELGWPSDGQPARHATASVSNQAKVLREFLNRADQEKVTYYIVEAFDQPWKQSIEGSAGAYWGIFNADRLAKYPMDGDVLTLPNWEGWATGAAIFSIFLMGLFLFTRRSLKLPGIVFFGVITNLAASTIFWSVSVGAQQYQTPLTIAFWVILILMQILAAIILMIESLEIAEVVWYRKGVRTFEPLTPSAEFKYPKVSLHLPIHNEPPAMVRKTLEALAKVDYPNLEVLVMDNNTKDPAIWEPVRDDCERLGPMFRFFHLENWPGFKAGAINHALEQTAPDAEIIAVIDSDYILSPDWLNSMVPYFDNENVGFVQSPQDYRDRHQSTFKNFCYWEYAGFFNIGMVQRNEYNAIIQHGTMTMIRKSALLEVGKWAEWCICEDSELGLRLYEAGYDSVYVKDSFGRGLMPDTFSGYMTQRFRWVYGAMQIIKGHWRSFLPTQKSPLTAAQRYYFIAGWLPWFSDALALLFTSTSLLLTAVIVYDPIHSELPVNAFLLPTIGLFSFKILRGLWLYQARVPCSVWQSLGAALSGLALTHTVSKGTIQGLFTSGKPFMRTPKYEQQGPLIAGLMIIRQELILLFLLGAAIAAMASLEHFDNLSGKLWISVLSVQAVPYVATLITLLISIAPSYGKKAKLAEELDEE